MGEERRSCYTTFMSEQLDAPNTATNTAIDTYIEPAANELEPGLLSVFRLIVGVHLGFVFVATAAGLLIGDRDPNRGSSWMVLWLLLLIVYLWWPGLQEQLGRFYLPLGLTIATLAPLLERALTLSYLFSVELPVDIQYAVIGTGWQLVLALFLPLTLIAWQYRYREVFLFVAATTVIELLLTWLVWRPESIESWIVVGVTFSRAIIYLIVGYVITRMIGAQREQRQKLADANARLSHYAATVEQLAVSHERNRLARELHDTLAHRLSSLSVQLEAVESVWRKAPDQAHELLVKARANARSGLTETRRALQALRASPLEDLGLVLAVDNLATATAARNGLAMRSTSVRISTVFLQRRNRLSIARPRRRWPTWSSIPAHARSSSRLSRRTGPSYCRLKILGRVLMSLSSWPAKLMKTMSTTVCAGSTNAPA